MVYLGGKDLISNNYMYSQPLNNSNSYQINNGRNKSDIISFSGTLDKKEQNNKTKTIGYVLGGLALALGGALLFAKLKKTGKHISENFVDDIKKGADDLVKKNSDTSASEIKTSTKVDNSTKIKEDPIIGNTTLQKKDTTIKIQKQNISSQEEEIIKLQKQSEEVDGKIRKMNNKDKVISGDSGVSDSIKTNEIINPAKERSANEMFDSALDLYAEELSKMEELKGKKNIIRKILPEFQKVSKSNSNIITGLDDEKELLKLITAENKDFIVKQALPKVLARAKDLNINNIKSVKSILETVTPESIQKVDIVADITKKFNIKNSADTIDLFLMLKNDKDNFILKEVFPHFANNIEKYGIVSNSDLTSLLKVVTRENKEFMFNKALPTILKNAEKLEISGSEIAEIAKELKPNNLNNIQIITDNIDKFAIKDSMDCIIINKFIEYLKKDSNELLK